jgi:hypothetical protein
MEMDVLQAAKYKLIIHVVEAQVLHLQHAHIQDQLS